MQNAYRGFARRFLRIPVATEIIEPLAAPFLYAGSAFFTGRWLIGYWILQYRVFCMRFGLYEIRSGFYVHVPFKAENRPGDNLSLYRQEGFYAVENAC